jgi:hypothetical protein
MIAPLAHQGGWDEILLTAGLVLALLAVSRLRRRRSAGGTDDPRTPPRVPAADACAYCGATLAPDDVRCPACGFRRGEVAG